MRYSFLIIFITLLLPLTLFSSDRGDYASRPEMKFNFHHLSLELSVNNEGKNLSGIAEYEVSPRQDDLRDVLIFAHNMEVERIRVAQDQVGFQQQGDSLIVQLANSFQADERFNLEITYEAEPEFGVHFNENGTVWTSMLPKSNRNWLPGFDHPRVELSTSIYIRIPEDQEAVANGKFLSEETVEDGYKEVGWKSDDKIPLSDISFVTGYFDIEETLVGTKQVRLYAETGLLDEGESSNLLQNIYDRIRETERFLLFEYPYESFNLIAIHDDRWETRSYNSGLGYVFANRGELAPQIANSVYAQWFGMHQRPEQWGDAEATLLYQAWLADHFDQAGLDGPSERSGLSESSSVYDNFSTAQRKRFIQFVQRQEGPELINMMASQARNVLDNGDTVMGWDDYARFWYDQTGENWFRKPEFPKSNNQISLNYDIEINHENLNGGLVAYITPEYSNSDKNYTLPVILFNNENEEEREYEFSGRGDTLTISDDDDINNVALGTVPGISFNEKKPFSFWLYQLRNDPDSERRKQAALAMENFSDQPDLQLALNGALNREDDPEVRAAVLKAMAEITDGAPGVQSWFLSRLDDEHEAIQREALRALRYYPDDDVVERDVFEVISMSDNIDLVNEAISVYRHLVPEADFVEFVDQFLNEDEERLFTYTLINEIYKTSEVEFANEIVDGYLGAENPFNIRFASFQQLNWNDYDNERWAERVKTFISDPDPRIRFLMMNRINTLSHEDHDRLLIERKSKEKDVRVLPDFDAL
ncbi:MAG: HEAT repeat domain-containing protein [Balneolales bacterium]